VIYLVLKEKLPAASARQSRNLWRKKMFKGEKRRGGNNCKTSEKNSCGIMSLGWNGVVSEYSK
jgi:hypothetical protein